MSDLIRVGSTLYGFNSESFKFDGVPYQGIQGVSSSEKRTRKLVRAAKRSGTPMGRTSGVYEPGMITIKMLKDSAQVLLTQLALKGLGSFGDTEFTFTAQVWEPAIGPITPILFLATGCTLDELKDDAQEGPDETTTELSIQPLMILRNGVRLASLIREIPI